MLPDKIKISGIDYKIVVAENKQVQEGTLLGEISYTDATIYLNECQNSQQIDATLLHEIVHGILYHMGSEMNDSERFVEGFSSGLHQVFRDNNWSYGVINNVD